MSAVKGPAATKPGQEPGLGPSRGSALVPEQRRRFAQSLARMSGTGAVRRVRDPREILEGQNTPIVRRRDATVRRSLAVADLLATGGALTAACAVAGETPSPAVIFAPLLMVLLAKLARLYDRDEHVIRKSTLDQAPELTQAATAYTLVVWLVSGVFVAGGFDNVQAGVLWVTLILALFAFRMVARRVAERSASPERLLVLGSAEAAERLRTRIESAHSINAILVGRVALSRDDRGRPRPLGPLDDLDFVLRDHGVERVIIAPSEQTSDEQLDTIRLVKSLGVKVSVLPRLFEVVGSSMEFDDVDGITLLGLRRYGLSRTSWLVKRSFDLVVVTIGLVLLTPLLSVVATAIRLTSSGPVLFRQPRIGRRGERFEMLKFRTMYDGADAEKAKLRERNETNGLFKLFNDPRVTPVGRILRQTSIDELPQLINVLRGEMSLVGPRPLVEEEDRLIAGWHHRRREGTPGMTGVWQVLGSPRVPLDEMVKMDYLYRANWSLWLDLKILLRTVGHVLNQRGL